MADVLVNIETGEEIHEEIVESQIEGTSTEETGASTEAEAGDKRLNGSDEDDGEGEDSDLNTGDGNTDAEREAIRERRREERKHRKQAAREREDSLRRELSARDTVINEMRAKLDALERRSTGGELAAIENAKKQVAQSYAFHKDQIRIATEAGNGAAVADATEKMLQAQRKFDELNNYERVHRQRAEAPQPLDARLVNHAKQWMETNKWYNPVGTDQESRIVAVIDQTLAQEGWNPTTPEYWQELTERVKKHLPHRAGRATVATTKPRSVVTGSGRESGGTRQSSSNTYKLSADRVQALKDAGLWDDPKQRAEGIKRFREYDKQHQGE